MAYDHSNKIGNQGDLVKHIALFAALGHLIELWPRTREFIYGDIHAGRPAYVLPKNGEWRFGIGKFSEKPEFDDDQSDAEAADLRMSRKFHHTFLGQRMVGGRTYMGSSGIAFRILSESPLAWRMKLWEKDAETAGDIEGYFENRDGQVMVTCGDGYEGARDGSPLCFALIDPPSLESAAVLATMANLNERGVGFVCWTPRTSRSVKPKTPHGAWSAAEAGTSTRYANAAAGYGSCFRVRWHKWGSRTPGCCITVSTSLSEAVLEALKQVTSLMGWELES